jgi:hypothetical protein
MLIRIGVTLMIRSNLRSYLAVPSHMIGSAQPPRTSSSKHVYDARIVDLCLVSTGILYGNAHSLWCITSLGRMNFPECFPYPWSYPGAMYSETM